jgi:hypothetical protein
MTAIVEARRHIEGLMRPGEKLKAALPRIARTVGINPRRARSLWSGHAVTRADELDALREASAKEAAHAIRTENLIHARTLEEHAARLAVVDPDFHREAIDELRDLARRARALAAGDRP